MHGQTGLLQHQAGCAAEPQVDDLVGMRAACRVLQSPTPAVHMAPSCVMSAHASSMEGADLTMPLTHGTVHDTGCPLTGCFQGTAWQRTSPALCFALNAPVSFLSDEQLTPRWKTSGLGEAVAELR